MNKINRLIIQHIEADFQHHGTKGFLGPLLCNILLVVFVTTVWYGGTFIATGIAINIIGGMYGWRFDTNQVTNIFSIVELIGSLGSLFFFRHGSVVELFFPLSIIFRTIIIHTLHLVLPGRGKRVKEIDDYIKVVTEAKLEAKPNAVDHDFYVNQLRSDPNTFLETYFQHTQSFKRFFLERISENGAVLNKKLHFLMLIPRVKTLPLDSLREIILSLNLLEHTEFNDPINLINKVKVDELFKNFTDEQIKQVFTRSFTPDSYLKLLDVTRVSQYSETPLLPGKTIKDVLDQSPALIEQIKLNVFHPQLLLMKIPQGETKVLVSKDDYESASKMFSNCVRGYYGKKESDIVLVTHQGNPVACMEVKNSKIIQISGYRNRVLNKEDYRIIYESFNQVIN